MKVTYVDGTTEQFDDDPFASGAEGGIYHARDRGKLIVVKLYHPDPAKDATRIERIDKLINDFNPTRGSSYWKQFFTWPEKRVVRPYIGFRMPFVGGVKTLEYYIRPKVFKRLKLEERGWFLGRIIVAMHLANAANRLDTQGLCYPDFSDRNIMVNPFTGKMVLIDCDSLTVPSKLPPTVEGTTHFRAPEIVQRLVATPSVISDRHALAVILYYWLLLWHPLQGDKQFDLDDPEHDDRLRFGQKAVYIEHPSNENKASKQTLKAAMLGAELETLFEKAFVLGLHHPQRRPSPREWLKALYHTYDRIIPCSSPYCDWRFFVATDTDPLVCPRCGQAIREPDTVPFIYLFPYLDKDYADDELDAHYIVGWLGRYLHSWHLSPDEEVYSAGTSFVPDARPYGVFDYDIANQKWSFTNKAIPSMRYRLPDQNESTGTTSWLELPPNSSIALDTDMLLQFGPAPHYFRAKVRLERVR